jgi:hypothetical protein
MHFNIIISRTNHRFPENIRVMVASSIRMYWTVESMKRDL